MLIMQALHLKGITNTVPTLEYKLVHIFTIHKNNQISGKCSKFSGSFVPKGMSNTDRYSIFYNIMIELANGLFFQCIVKTGMDLFRIRIDILKATP